MKKKYFIDNYEDQCEHKEPYGPFSSKKKAGDFIKDRINSKYKRLDYALDISENITEAISVESWGKEWSTDCATIFYYILE